MLLPMALTAALDARYAYWDPEELSPMEPMRDVTMPICGDEEARMLERRAWVRNMGPKVLTSKTRGDIEEEVDGFIAEGVFELLD